jgi:beta-lactam-binding protein with PASTA domain
LLTTDGLQLPEIALSEVEGNDGTVPPEHMVRVDPKLKVGVTLGLTVTVNVAATAHCPAVGVKLYVAEPELLTVDGLQVPLIPLADVAGSDGTVPPAQMVKEVPKLNTGVTFGLTVTV